MNENTDDKIDLQHLRISSLKTNSGVDKLFWNFLSIVFFIFYCKKINMMGLPKIPHHPHEYADNWGNQFIAFFPHKILSLVLRMK